MKLLAALTLASWAVLLLAFSGYRALRGTVAWRDVEPVETV